MPIMIMLVISGLVSLPSPPETLDNIPVAVRQGSEASSSHECIYLIGDYGFYINWPDKEPPEILCFERKPAKLISFSSINECLSWLQTLPEGARVDQIRTCKRTQAGMPRAASGRLQRIIHDKKLHLTDETEGNFVVCLCEGTEFRIFKTLDEARSWMAKNKGQYRPKDKPEDRSVDGVIQETLHSFKLLCRCPVVSTGALHMICTGKGWRFLLRCFLTPIPYNQERRTPRIVI